MYELEHDEAVTLSLAAEKRWMQLLCDGSYTLAESAEQMNPGALDPARVLTLRRSGELLAFEYAGEMWCPKYQFAGGTELRVVSQLLKVTRDVGAPDADLALFMVTQSSLFPTQDTPADHLAWAAQIVETAHIHFEAVW
ncbi:hypothetical protein [Pseudarthrobacter sp. PH31-O2]|uniref:hypothetical protein n=1 Tax=Pseudarthrobacter sp. PH31-O2 TaxID=3046206 RepID=UPI0024B8CD1D|nr:hypothetical protein [Pseudarthrobacter sp. PH31-O2]MDJ0354404.1 hypothetical protein [Pseudarthrobacter sp. PH31-O2]